MIVRSGGPGLLSRELGHEKYRVPPLGFCQCPQVKVTSSGGMGRGLR